MGYKKRKRSNMFNRLNKRLWGDPNLGPGNIPDRRYRGKYFRHDIGYSRYQKKGGIPYIHHIKADEDLLREIENDFQRKDIIPYVLFGYKKYLSAFDYLNVGKVNESTGEIYKAMDLDSYDPTARLYDFMGAIPSKAKNRSNRYGYDRRVIILK